MTLVVGTFFADGGRVSARSIFASVVLGAVGSSPATEKRRARASVGGFMAVEFHYASPGCGARLTVGLPIFDCRRENHTRCNTLQPVPNPLAPGPPARTVE